MRASLLLLVLPSVALAQGTFTHQPAGVLQSGDEGLASSQIWVPGMRYPLEESPSYPNSQVYGPGGLYGPGGGQCDASNYDYPWWDNYCEKRTWSMPLCPAGTGHQGQDIRAATCEKNKHWAVAAEAGTVTNIGSYSVYVTTSAGMVHRYLHMNPATLQVSTGASVNKGDKLGQISNTFFDSEGNSVATSIHLHYDIRTYVANVGGNAYVSPYTSLIASYEALLGQESQPCDVVPAAGGVVDEQGPCFLKWGSSQYWREENAGVGGHMFWTNAWDGASPGNWARWLLNLEAGGEYIVEVNVVSPWNAAKEVIYDVRANGQDYGLLLDQSTGDGWRLLGTWTFAAGGEQWVDVIDNTGETASDLHITVDAIRLTPVPVDPGTDTGGTTAGGAETTGGDTTGGSSTTDTTGGASMGGGDTGGGSDTGGQSTSGTGGPTTGGPTTGGEQSGGETTSGQETTGTGQSGTTTSGASDGSQTSGSDGFVVGTSSGPGAVRPADEGCSTSHRGSPPAPLLLLSLLLLITRIRSRAGHLQKVTALLKPGKHIRR
ncbi:MAG: hypothetical protein ACI9WU_003764 [Myxococcota bacterium]|jgi:hypothetical protein